MHRVLSCALACAMNGVEGLIVRVETDAAAGTPSLSIIGLPDRSLHESRDRVRAALANAGYALPPGRLLVNLAPAHVRGSIRYTFPRSNLDTVRPNSDAAQAGTR